MRGKVQKPNLYIIDAVFVSLICLIAVGVCGFTNHWKFGLSPDSCGYISCGINISHGKGIAYDEWNLKTGEIEQQIRLQQPPLYPIAIALLSKLGFQSASAAFFISFTSMLLSSVIVYFIARLLAGQLCGFVCAFLCATTVAYINKGFWAWTEPPFTLLVLLALLFYVLADQASETKRQYGFTVGCAAMLVLCFYYRYIGLFAIVPFGVGYLRKSFKSKGDIKRLITFCTIVILGVAPMLIINQIHSGSITGAKRAAESNLFWQTMSSAVSSLTGIFFGGLIKWQPSLQQDYVQAKAAVFFVCGAIALYIWLVYKDKKPHVILGYILISFISLVFLRSTTFFDGLESHGSRLLSPVIPAITIALGLVFNKILVVYKKEKNWFIAAILIFLFGSLHITFQCAYAKGRAADYASGGMQKATETLSWMENNIPEDSKILINYQARQITPFTEKYYTKGFSSTKGRYWDSERFTDLIKNNKSTTWLVFIWHPTKNNRPEVSRYGPYVQTLLTKGKNQEFELVANLKDGVVFRSIAK